jgi:hemoglobin
MGRFKFISGFFTLFLFVAACESNKPVPLYYRLGGDQMVSAIVDDFLERAMADPRVNFTRKGTDAHWDPTPENFEKLRAHVFQFFQEATGDSTADYMGRDMKSSHANMRITNAEFDAIKNDLEKSLVKFDTPAKESSEVLALVEGTRKDIVEVK